MADLFLWLIPPLCAAIGVYLATLYYASVDKRPASPPRPYRANTQRELFRLLDSIEYKLDLAITKLNDKEANRG